MGKITLNSNPNNRYYYKWMSIYIVIYRILLDIDYRYAIADLYAYTFGTPIIEVSRALFSYAILIAFIPIIMKTAQGQKLSDIIVFFIFVMAFVPGTSFYRFNAISNKMYLMWITYFIFLFIFNEIFPRFKIVMARNSKLQLLIYCCAFYFTAIILFIWIFYARFRINFDLDNVYEARVEASAYSLPLLLQYSYGMSKTVMATLLIYFMYVKKRFMIIIIAISQLISFFVDGSKSVLFVLILALVGYFFFDMRIKIKAILVCCSLMVLGIIEHIVLGVSQINAVLIRRMLFLPEHLNIFYYDFFSQNEKDFFRQSIFRRIGLESPYEKPINSIIGYMHSGSWSEGANNGMFSDAYANLGAIGMLIMPFIIVLALRFLEGSAEGVDNRLLFASMITIPLNIISSSFFTVLLTHGFILLCIIFLCMPRNVSTVESERRT